MARCLRAKVRRRPWRKNHVVGPSTRKFGWKGQNVILLDHRVFSAPKGEKEQGACRVWHLPVVLERFKRLSRRADGILFTTCCACDGNE